MSVVTLLALVSITTTVGAEETTREARVEVTIPQSGNVMGVGFNFLWMMSLTTNKIIRINPDDNSVTEMPSLERLVHSLMPAWLWEKVPFGCLTPAVR
jgi:hypothetical protein